MRGSRPGFGYQSGTFCVTLDNQYNSQGWPINATLSFKPIYNIKLRVLHMHIVVVVVIMVFIVVSFVFI